MKKRQMLGDTIYRLRKEKGLSQAELGTMVGVSNKAVSKWETDESNPEISLLPLIAEALDVSLDELLQGVKAEKQDFAPQKKTVFGIAGTVTDTAEEYEFVSDRHNEKDVPFLHIHIGKTVSTIGARAKGTIAIGNIAQGKLAIGLISKGWLSLGLISIGLLSFGLLAVGLLAFGSFAIGGIAFGGIALGIASVGGVAIGAVAAIGGIAIGGLVAIGGVAIGWYAITGETGYAVGKIIIIIKSILQQFH